MLSEEKQSNVVRNELVQVTPEVTSADLLENGHEPSEVPLRD